MTRPRKNTDIAIDTSDLQWQDNAACVGTDPDAFFPEGPPKRETIQTCHACPAFPDCLAYALERPELAGIWAATTGEERHRMRRAAQLNARQVWRG